MYDNPLQEAPLFQGDIFCHGFVFPYSHNPVEEVEIVRAGTTQPVGEVEDSWSGGSELILTPAHKAEFAIILSNTCDMIKIEPEEGKKKKDPLEYVLLGGVLPLSEVTGDRNKLTAIRGNNKIRYHYLESNERASLNESIIHFGYCALVSWEALMNLRDKRVLTLRSPFRESLGHRFGEFFSRVALP